ncbi:MAG: ABC transporter permease [Anaerolineae bacterium]|nr:ABC transporter permease [Anaerolineae bacterium]
MTLFLRLGQGVAIIWLAATVTFLTLRVLPGDAISEQMAFSGASPEIIAQRQQIMGLTAPPVEQYVRFIGGLLVGELGYSLLDGQPVLMKIGQQIIPTVTLAVGALIFAVIIGVGLGVAAATDLIWGMRSAAQIITDLALSMPIYWTGTLIIYLFTVGLGVLPSTGAGELNQLVLPVSVLGFHTGGAIARVTAANLRDVSKADFVRTAYAKGLSRKTVLLRHILPAGLPSVIAVIALQAGFLLSGTVITESLFVRPGLGRLLLDSVLWQDYPVVQGIVVFSAVVYVMLSVIADIFYRLMDPRVVVI